MLILRMLSASCLKMRKYNVDYRLWALLSAISAGATALLAKKGVEDVPAHLALAVRVFFILVISVGVAIITRQTGLASLTKRTWLFLFLSAVVTGLSWLCYFQALKHGPITRVAPIDKLSFIVAMILGFVFLGEKVTPQLVCGAVLIVAGVLVTLIK